MGEGIITNCYKYPLPPHSPYAHLHHHRHSGGALQGCSGHHRHHRPIAATNYDLPIGAYRLVRVRGVKSRILDPRQLDQILSILEREGETELWQALAQSQPFTSAKD